MEDTEGLKNKTNYIEEGENEFLRRRVKRLGRILKKVRGFRFNMRTKSGRILFQKIVYFLQVFGIDLEYEFSWYIHGPYSSPLASDGFELVDFYAKLEDLELRGERKQQFEKFLRFLGDRANDRYWLELLASIHFFKHMGPSYSKKEVLKAVLRHQEYFTPENFEVAWEYLDKYNLVCT